MVAKSAEDKLGWAIIYVRALENRNFARVAQAAKCIPQVNGCGKLALQNCMSLNERDLGKHVGAVRDMIISPAREDINADLADLRSSRGDEDQDEHVKSKDSILRKLKRLSPGEASVIGCVADDLGNFHNAPEAMAKVLCDYWSKVFGPSDSDVRLLKTWMNQLFPENSDGSWISGILHKDSPRWQVIKNHIAKAIRQAKESLPGPDGIPALAYKRLGPLAVDVLHDVFESLSSSNAHDTLVKAFESMSPAQSHDFNVSIMCLLPKKATGHDTDMGNFFHPGDTRPLSVSNVDNRMLASAARIAWEPILEEWVSEAQRGFLKGRSMLHNVIEIDWSAMKVSLKHEHGAIILFDFKAAFPSVAHSFLINCLRMLGLPGCVMNFISSLYSCNKCYIRMQGGDYPGFNMLSGVKQGCPLSPLLFAVCVDILLRMIDKEVGEDLTRAFADDIAVVLISFHLQAPLLEKIFADFERISNLGLNIKKTVCIPLWTSGIGELQHSISKIAPLWADIKIDSKGTYLGFVIGHGKGPSSWTKPLERYKDRVKRWSKVGGGMQLAALAYNIFALSTLLYVAQLEPIPNHVYELERENILKMFPGAGTWAICEDLWYLRENFGLAKSAQPLVCIARAAKIRIAYLGCHFGCKSVTKSMVLRPGSDNIFSRWKSLQSCMRQTEHFGRLAEWESWYQNSFCKTLVENVRWCNSKNITVNSILDDIGTVDNHGVDEAFCKVKREFQKNALKAIKKVDAPDPVERIRHKMERWRGITYGISGNPGQYSNCMARRIKSLASLVTPRVQAAVFTTMWNGWCTHRRFQQRALASNKCVFKCSQTSEDSLEHYCRCPTVLRVAKHYFHFAYPKELALDLWTLNSYWLDIDDNFRGLALLVYGAYMAFNTIRHNGISDSNQAYQCIMQHCKLGCGGHPACIKFVDSCWSRPMNHIC